jgi:hypothetical protein
MMAISELHRCGFPTERQLDLADREKPEKLALERLYATTDDEEQWSFVFRTDGALCMNYCPWWETEDWEFDGRD